MKSGGSHRISRKPSRSRASSERISLLEATRRDRISKLIALRSQIEAIEKDIEHDEVEAAKLQNEEMTDDMPSDSEQEHVDASQMAEASMATPDVLSSQPTNLTAISA